MENFTINRQNKTFVFDDGEEVPIPKDKQREVLRSKHAKGLKEKTKEAHKKDQQGSLLPESVGAFKSSAEQSFLGNPGATVGEYIGSGIKGLTPGEGQEDLGYIDRVLDNFYAVQEGRKEAQNELSERNPISSGLGTATGMGAELLALRKLPAAAALPIMGAGHSDTSILEPMEKLPEVGKEALIGAVLDKFFGGLNKVAGHRQTRRGVQNAINTTEAANAAEIESTNLANQAERQRFARDTTAREAQVSQIPGLQRAENDAFVNASSQNIGRVSQTLGKTPIANEAMGVEPFINDVIETSAMAGSKEGNRVSNFLRSIFKGNAEGKITGDTIQKGMRSVDELILKEGGEIGNLLSQFRSFVTQELPSKLGNYYAYEKWFPKIQARLLPAIERDLTSAFKNGNEVFKEVQSKMGKGFLTNLNKEIKTEIDGIFKSHAGDFETALQNGTITQEIQAAIESNPSYQKIVDNLIDMKSGKLDLSKTQSSSHASKYPLIINKPAPAGFDEVQNAVMNYPNQVADKFTSVAERYMPDIRLDITTKSGITENSLQKLPQSPNVVPQPSPVNPAQMANPNLAPVPQIPQPQGVMQRLAYGLENMGEMGIGGVAQGVKDNATTGLLAKMAGVPLGKIAATAVGAATGLSALTSPAAAAVAGRSIIEQSARMIDAVNQRAQQYPSHRGNGILDNPMERRSLVREIEDDMNMKIEDKAQIQSKINRGQPLIAQKFNQGKQPDRKRF